MWILIITIGMVLGIPKVRYEYDFPNKQECEKVKQEWLKDNKNIGDTFTIICVPKQKDNK